MLQGQVISLGIRLGRGFGQGITVPSYAYRHYLLKGQIFAFDSRGKNYFKEIEYAEIRIFEACDGGFRKAKVVIRVSCL